MTTDHGPHTLSCTIPAAPPLVAGATTFAPIQGALWVLGIAVNLRVEQQRKKNHTTGSSARGNAPLLPPSAASPPEGEILAALYPVVLVGSMLFCGFILSPA